MFVIGVGFRLARIFDILAEWGKGDEGDLWYAAIEGLFKDIMCIIKEKKLIYCRHGIAAFVCQAKVATVS
jgi:hypothetical protein